MDRVRSCVVTPDDQQLPVHGIRTAQAREQEQCYKRHDRTIGGLARSDYPDLTAKVGAL